MKSGLPPSNRMPFPRLALQCNPPRLPGLRHLPTRWGGRWRIRRVGATHNPHIDPSGSLQPHKLLALYHTMVMARAITRRLWVYYTSPPAGDVARCAGVDAGWGRSHRISAGAEAVQVAAAAALRPGTDWIVPHHKDLALRLAGGVSPLDVMMTALGRTSDLGSRRTRMVTISGLAGTHIPHAAGIAYASKLAGRDEVVLVSIDDRGTDSGDWHEGINFASTHKLPLICLVQDDFPRAAAPPGQTATHLIVRRAHGYGMAAEGIDGGDFGISLETLVRAAGRARAGEGPTLVHA